MKFNEAVTLLKQGGSLYHPSMQDETYFTYTADLNIYHHIGLPKGLILDAMVFFETYGKQQFDSLWCCRSPQSKTLEKIIDILEKHYFGRNFIENRAAEELLELFKKENED